MSTFREAITFGGASRPAMPVPLLLLTTLNDLYEKPAIFVFISSYCCDFSVVHFLNAVDLHLTRAYARSTSNHTT